jgi:hypothetical protein
MHRLHYGLQRNRAGPEKAGNVSIPNQKTTANYPKSVIQITYSSKRSDSGLAKSLVPMILNAPVFPLIPPTASGQISSLSSKFKADDPPAAGVLEAAVEARRLAFTKRQFSTLRT